MMCAQNVQGTYSLSGESLHHDGGIRVDEQVLYSVIVPRPSD